MPACSFHHEAIFHSGGADGFVDHFGPLIERALEDRAPVLVAVSSERISRLREALDSSAAAEVGFADIRVLGANPARIIPAWHAFLQRHRRHDRQTQPLGIGEPVWPGRSAAELEECGRHEGLLNLAFGGGRGWRLLCPYDLDGLQDDAIALARMSHPFISRSGESAPNEDYPSEQMPDWPFDGELQRPQSHTRELDFDERDLLALRDFVSRWASEEALEAESAQELVLAVHEIATNSVRHGGGRGTLSVWREQGTLLCEIRDRGRIENPMLGRVQPGEEAMCSRGLWIANQLCDLVQIRSSAAGSQVRMHKRLS